MNSILMDLNHPLPIVKFRGFYNCVAQKNATPEIIDILRELKSDTRMAVGRRMCDYAEATLHLLGVETYTGNNEDVWLLIDTKMGQLDN